MGYSGAGSYTLPAGSIVADGTSADAADLNTPLQDLETALNLAFLRDGRTPATGNFAMGNFKVTGMGSGTAATDAAALSQVQTDAVGHATTVNSGGGTVDALRLAFSPANTALTTNEIVRWTSPGANTITAPTLSKDAGLTNKTIKKGAGAALVAGDTGAIGYVCWAEYNGTDWILLNPATENGNVLLAGNNAFTGSNTHAGTETFSGPTINTYVALVDAGTIAWDMSAGTNFKVTITANRIFGAPTNLVEGQEGSLLVIQDATGGRTLTWNAAYKFPNNNDEKPSPETEASSLYRYFVRGATDVIIKKAWISARDSIGFFKEYDKGALAGNTSYSQAHGLGRHPPNVKIWIENVTTDIGYVAGDRVLVSMGNDDANASGCIYTDTTNAVMLTRSAGFGLQIPNKGTRVLTGISVGNWKVIMRIYE